MTRALKASLVLALACALCAGLAPAQQAPAGSEARAREVAEVRAKVGPKIVLCTPGIRPAGAAANDQARTETPAAAIQAGSDLLVIGRPITTAPDMAAAAKAIEAELS